MATMCLTPTHAVGERVVEIAGQGCPCGGTHVKNLALIKGIKVTKIKKVNVLLTK